MEEDVRQANPILEELSSGDGKVVHLGIIGETQVGKNSIPTFSFVDTNNNFIRPKLDAEQRLPVTFEGQGAPKEDVTKVDGSLSFVDVAKIPALTATKVHTKVYAKLSSFRDYAYELLHIDDPAGTPVETLLDHDIGEPGKPTSIFNPQYIEFTAGATAPVLTIRAKNIRRTSDFRGTLHVIESGA